MSNKLVCELLGMLESEIGYHPSDRDIVRVAGRRSGYARKIAKELVTRLGLDVNAYVHREWR